MRSLDFGKDVELSPYSPTSPETPSSSGKMGCLPPRRSPGRRWTSSLVSTQSVHAPRGKHALAVALSRQMGKDTLPGHTGLVLDLFQASWRNAGPCLIRDERVLARTAIPIHTSQARSPADPHIAPKTVKGGEALGLILPLHQFLLVSFFCSDCIFNPLAYLFANEQKPQVASQDEEAFR